LPDASIFEETVFDTEILLTRLREQAFLNAGVRIILRDLRGDEAAEFDMCYQGGIASFVEYIHKKRALEPLHDEVIYFMTTEGDSCAEVAMQYNDSYNELILSLPTTSTPARAEATRSASSRGLQG
jgi:DNA gyrase subunit B